MGSVEGLVLLLCILTPNHTATIIFPLLCIQVLRRERTSRKKFACLLYPPREWVLIFVLFIHSFCSMTKRFLDTWLSRWKWKGSQERTFQSMSIHSLLFSEKGAAFCFQVCENKSLYIFPFTCIPIPIPFLIVSKNMIKPFIHIASPVLICKTWMALTWI